MTGTFVDNVTITFPAGWLTAPVGLPATSVDNFTFFCNGQFIEATAIASFTQSNGISTLVINPSLLSYDFESTDEVIVDDYGNVVMQPGGVLNVDVHNDLPYMNMTGVENESPKIEELILTAIGENQFSIEAESLTHKGDLLLYYCIIIKTFVPYLYLKNISIH